MDSVEHESIPIDVKPRQIVLAYSDGQILKYITAEAPDSDMVLAKEEFYKKFGSMIEMLRESVQHEWKKTGKA